ncbi:STAS domain-containing protein [Magnetococcales bacterium HHB-1]
MNMQTFEVDTHILKLSGEFDAQAVKAQRAALDQLVEESKKDVVVDLSEVFFIDSSGIGALVFLYKRLAAQSYKLYLVGPSGQPLSLLEQLRINQTIPTFDSLNALIETLHPAQNSAASTTTP